MANTETTQQEDAHRAALRVELGYADGSAESYDSLAGRAKKLGDSRAAGDWKERADNSRRRAGEIRALLGETPQNTGKQTRTRGGAAQTRGA